MNCLKYEKYVLSFLMFSRLDSKSHIARVIDHKMTAKSCKKPCLFLKCLFMVLFSGKKNDDNSPEIADYASF